MTYQASTAIRSAIASGAVMRPYMMRRLMATSPAPSQTKRPFQRQITSTRWPSGIFSAQGMPAQKLSPARKAAERPR